MITISKIVIMSNNDDKLNELNYLMQDTGIPVYGYKSVIGYNIDVIEDGQTYAENAIKKVQCLPERDDCIYLGDDSGLEVDALNGEPGIYSARYAGQSCSYEDNCHKLIDALKDTKERSARFFCTIAIRFPKHFSKPIETIEGVVEGTIVNSWKKGNGFGYDPIFIPTGHDLPFSSFSFEQKHSISHRGKAITKTKLLIQTFLKQFSKTT